MFSSSLILSSLIHEVMFKIITSCIFNSSLFLIFLVIYYYLLGYNARFTPLINTGKSFKNLK